MINKDRGCISSPRNTETKIEVEERYFELMNLEDFMPLWVDNSNGFSPL